MRRVNTELGIIKVLRRMGMALFRLRDLFPGRTVYVLGDSHVRVFSEPWLRVFFPGTRFSICKVQGAIASGLTNPDPRDHYYHLVRCGWLLVRALRAPLENTR